MRITACTALGRITAANVSSWPTSASACRACVSAAAAGLGAAAPTATRCSRRPRNASLSRPLRRRTASATDASSRLAAGRQGGRRLGWVGQDRPGVCGRHPTTGRAGRTCGLGALAQQREGHVELAAGGKHLERLVGQAARLCQRRQLGRALQRRAARGVGGVALVQQLLQQPGAGGGGRHVEVRSAGRGAGEQGGVVGGARTKRVRRRRVGKRRHLQAALAGTHCRPCTMAAGCRKPPSAR